MNLSRFPSPRIHRSVRVSHDPQVSSRRQLNTRNQKNRLVPLDPNATVSEFMEPEYLKEQKMLLINEIRALKPEIEGLSKEFNRLQNQYKYIGEGQTKIEDSSPQTWLSSKLSQLHAEHDQLTEELAYVRRHYSEQTENTLSTEINYQRADIAMLNNDYAQIKKQLDNDTKQLQEIYKGDISLLIQNNKKEIVKLKKELASLTNKEQKMIEQYMTLMNDVSQMEQGEQLILQKKRNLKQAQYNKMKASVDLRRLKKEFEEKKKNLLGMINELQNKAKKEQEYRKIMTSSRNYFITEAEAVTEEPITPSPRRVRFDPASTEGKGIPARTLENLYQFLDIAKGEEEDELNRDEDEFLDLSDFSSSLKLNSPKHDNDTFFADSVQEITQSLMLPPKFRK